MNPDTFKTAGSVRVQGREAQSGSELLTAHERNRPETGSVSHFSLTIIQLTHHKPAPSTDVNTQQTPGTSDVISHTHGQTHTQTRLLPALTATIHEQVRRSVSDPGVNQDMTEEELDSLLLVSLLLDSLCWSLCCWSLLVSLLLVSAGLSAAGLSAAGLCWSLCCWSLCCYQLPACLFINAARGHVVSQKSAPLEKCCVQVVSDIQPLTDVSVVVVSVSLSNMNHVIAAAAG